MDGRVELARGMGGGGHVGVKRRLGASDRQGLANVTDGGLGLARPDSDAAEKVQGIALARVQAQHLAIQLLGLRQPASLMVVEGLVHHIARLGH
jgi:hypothetical protein